MVGMAEQITNWKALGVLHCTRCNLKTSDAGLFQAHNCRPVVQVRNKASLKYKSQTKSFLCSLCNIDVPEDVIEEHLENHVSLKPYKCKHCQVACDLQTKFLHYCQEPNKEFQLIISNRTKELILRAQKNHEQKEYYLPLNVTVKSHLMTNSNLRLSTSASQLHNTPASQTLRPVHDVHSNSVLGRTQQFSKEQYSVPTAIETSPSLVTPSWSSVQGTSLESSNSNVCSSIIHMASSAQGHVLTHSTVNNNLSSGSTNASETFSWHRPAEPTGVQDQITQSKAKSVHLDSHPLTSSGVSNSLIKPETNNVLQIDQATNTTNVNSEINDNHLDKKQETSTSSFSSSLNDKSSEINKKDYSYLCVIKGYYLCLQCKMKWSECNLFFMHIWQQHTHKGDLTCCPNGFSLKCERLKTILRSIYSNVQEPVPEILKSNFKNIPDTKSTSNDVAKNRSNDAVENINSVAVGNQSNEAVKNISSVAVGNQSNEAVENISSVAVGNQSNESVENISSVAVGNQSNEAVENISSIVVGNQSNEAVENISSDAVGNQSNEAVEDDSSNEYIENSSSYEVVENSTLSPTTISTNTFQCASTRVSRTSVKHTDRHSTDSLELLDTMDTKNTEIKSYYQCGFQNCIYASMRPVDFLNHIEEVHGSETSFSCCYCGYVGASSSSLLDHLGEHIGTEDALVFSGSLLIDGIAYFYQSKDIHGIMGRFQEKLKTQAATLFTIICKTCQTMFSSLQEFRKHLISSLLKVISCKHCRSYFLDAGSWQKHRAKEHPNEPRLYCINRKLLCDALKQNNQSVPLYKNKVKRIDEQNSSEKTIEQITSQTAIEQITSQTAIEQISSQTAIEQISQTAIEEITSQTAIEQITSQTAIEQITSQTAIEQITSQTAIEQISNQAANENSNIHSENSGNIDNYSSDEADSTKKNGDLVTVLQSHSSLSPPLPLENNYNEPKYNTPDKSCVLQKLSDICGEQQTDMFLNAFYEHTDDNHFSCKKCKRKVFSLKRIHAHLFHCIGKMGVACCPHCYYEGEHSRLLVKHIEKEHPGKKSNSIIYLNVNTLEFMQALQSSSMSSETFADICADFKSIEEYIKISQFQSTKNLSELLKMNADSENSISVVDGTALENAGEKDATLLSNVTENKKIPLASEKKSKPANAPKDKTTISKQDELSHSNTKGDMLLEIQSMKKIPTTRKVNLWEEFVSENKLRPGISEISMSLADSTTSENAGEMHATPLSNARENKQTLLASEKKSKSTNASKDTLTISNQKPMNAPKDRLTISNQKPMNAPKDRLTISNQKPMNAPKDRLTISNQKPMNAPKDRLTISNQKPMNAPKDTLTISNHVELIKKGTKESISDVQKKMPTKRKLNSSEELVSENKHRPGSSSKITLSSDNLSNCKSDLINNFHTKKHGTNKTGLKKGEKHVSFQRYQCNLQCAYICKWNEASMVQHLKTSHPYQACGHCGAVYFTKVELENHCNFAHIGKKPCMTEDISVKDFFTLVSIKLNSRKSMDENLEGENMMDNLETSHDKSLNEHAFKTWQITADKNSLLSNSADTLSSHHDNQRSGKQTLHNATVKKCSKKIYPFKCSVCNCYKKCIADIVDHFRWLHAQQVVEFIYRKYHTVYTIRENSGTCKPGSKVPSAKHLCYFCSFRHYIRSEVETHIAAEHCGQEVKVLSLDFHEQVDRDKSDTIDNTQTNTCAKESTIIAAKPNPVAITKYNCPVCDDISSSLFAFRLHLAMKHEQFRHITVIRSMAGLLLCPICGYIANSQKDLGDHMAVHIQERQFICNLCNFDSHTRKGVLCHIKNVHININEPDVEIIDRKKQANLLKPALVNLEPTVAIPDCLHNDNADYLRNLLVRHDIKLLDVQGEAICENILQHKNKNEQYFDVRTIDNH